MEMIENFKIFLVDDNIFCLNLYQQILRNLGFHDVRSFQNGTDCLQNLHDYPSVIFLDMDMDELHGFEVLKKIKRFDPNINVVILSGQEDMQTAVNAMKYGAFDYLIKGDEVEQKIEQVLDRIATVESMLRKSKPSLLKRLML